VFADPVTAPDLISARYADDTRAEILLEFGQPIVWNDATVSELRLDGEAGGIRSGEAAGSTLRLAVAPGCRAATITYLVDRQWHPDRVLRGVNGIAALTFHAVSIEPPPTQIPSP
jgi:hypothetical protein